jgi:uncharacterized protein YegP (UPF0339 family)
VPAKFTVYRDQTKYSHFNPKASNGEIITTEKAYPDKKSALKGIASIQKNTIVVKIIYDTGEDALVKKYAVRKVVAPKVPAKVEIAPKPKSEL